MVYRKIIKTHKFTLHACAGTAFLCSALCTYSAPLRVATFNVEGGLGASGTTNYEIAAKYFERIGPDVLALEELQSDYANLAALQQRLGLPYSYRPTSSSMQVGLLSRYPLLASSLISQPGMTRPILLVQVDVPGVSSDPWVAVVHLKCCGSTGGSEQFTRATELYHLKQALATRGVTSQSNVILMGDFNLVATGDYVYGSGPNGLSPFPAPASADGYFTDLGILKLDLRHADGVTTWSWLSNGIFASSQLDHIMASGPIRSRSPFPEIYDVAKDAVGLEGRPKFGNRASSATAYGSDHLPVFADLVLRDDGDGFGADSSPPALVLKAASITLNSPGGSFLPAATDVLAVDDQDPAPVVTCYPLVNNFTSVGDRTITYLGRDRLGNIAKLNRVIRVVGAGATGFSANLQWPPRLSLRRDAAQIYARIFVEGMTGGTVSAPGVQAWIGISRADTPPSSWAESAWRQASLNAYADGASDEYMVTIDGSEFAPGTYRYAARWKVGNGSYLYGGINQSDPAGGGSFWNGVSYTSGLLMVSSTFSGWSGGAVEDAQAVAKYAIGGASSLAATDSIPSATSLSGDALSVTAIVRTNDPSLITYGVVATHLSAAQWTSNGVSMTPASSQTGAPEGCQIQIFSTPRSSEAAKFLRLQSTLTNQ